MSDNVLLDDLVSTLSTLEIAEESLIDSSLSFSIEKLQAGILSKFLQFVSQNAEFLPEKEVVLDMLSKAIDLAFTALNKPIIANILKPFVKKQILDIASKLYDSLLSPPSTQV